MNIYYVYQHLDPRTNEIRYVGKGKGKGKRAYKFIQRSGYHKNWINHLKSLGLEPVVEIVKKDLTDKESLNLETELIFKYKKEGVRLTNLTDGGDGSSGYKHTEEALKKMSKSKKGKPSPNKGKASSLETRKKLSKSHKGIYPSEETRKKKREAVIGSKNYKSKKVVDISTGFIWDTLREASEVYGINIITLCQYLTGKRKNKTGLRYAEGLV